MLGITALCHTKLNLKVVIVSRL